MEDSGKDKNEHTSLRDFLGLREVAGYFFRGRDQRRPVSFNIHAMHWINRIAIIIFLAGVIFMLLKRFF